MEDAVSALMGNSVVSSWKHESWKNPGRNAFLSWYWGETRCIHLKLACFWIWLTVEETRRDLDLFSHMQVRWVTYMQMKDGGEIEVEKKNWKDHNTLHSEERKQISISSQRVMHLLIFAGAKVDFKIFDWRNYEKSNYLISRQHFLCGNKLHLWIFENI